MNGKKIAPRERTLTRNVGSCPARHDQSSMRPN